MESITKINPENIEPESLEERLRNLYNDSESRNVYEFTLNGVTACLFSRFPKRREYALKNLSEFWGDANLTIHRVEEENFTKGYIKFSSRNKYILVAVYRNDSPVLEVMPTKEEMEEYTK